MGASNGAAGPASCLPPSLAHCQPPWVPCAAHQPPEPGIVQGPPADPCSASQQYAAALLGSLTEDLHDADDLVRLDADLNASLLPCRASWLVAGFLWITALGTGPAVTDIAATVSTLLWTQSRAWLFAPFWTTLTGAEETTWLGKHLIGRVRPAFLDAVSESSSSLPSGHATAPIGFLTYAAACGLRQRFEVPFWAATVIGLVCSSLVFLSLNYLSDIAAGVLVGMVWLLAGVGAAELSQSPSALGQSG